MESDSSLSPEILLGQADFVRALARSLLADAAAADDLAQDTLTAALEGPPLGAGRARAWLGSVLRNLLRERRRGEANRSARERASARVERVPSTVEVNARVTCLCSSAASLIEAPR